MDYIAGWWRINQACDGLSPREVTEVSRRYGHDVKNWGRSRKPSTEQVIHEHVNFISAVEDICDFVFDHSSPFLGELGTSLLKG